MPYLVRDALSSGDNLINTVVSIETELCTGHCSSNGLIISAVIIT